MKRLLHYRWHVASFAVIVAIAFSVTLLIALASGGASGTSGEDRDVPPAFAPGSEPRTDPIPVNPWGANSEPRTDPIPVNPWGANDGQQEEGT